MKSSKLVTVVHPDSIVRRSLGLALERHGYRVFTDHSCRGMLSGDLGVIPDLILLDRTLLSDEGYDLLSQLNRLWEEALTIFLPESLSKAGNTLSSLSPLLDVIDRLLGMSTTRELLA